MVRFVKRRVLEVGGSLYMCVGQVIITLLVFHYRQFIGQYILKHKGTASDCKNVKCTAEGNAT